MKSQVCSCGNRINPWDKFCTSCGRKRPKKRGVIFLIILLSPFLAVLCFVLANLWDYAAEYLPYLSDQKGFQTEWYWEAGFDEGYQLEGSINSLLNSNCEFSSDVNPDYKKATLTEKQSSLRNCKEIFS